MRHDDQLLHLPAEPEELWRERGAELVVDGHLPVCEPRFREDRLELGDQLVCRGFGTEIDREGVGVVHARQAGREQRSPVRGRDDFLHEPLVEAALEVDRALHSPSLCGCWRSENSAMSRRKNRAVVQSATMRSFRESIGTWYRWYVRVIHHARKPRRRMCPGSSAMPR